MHYNGVNQSRMFNTRRSPIRITESSYEQNAVICIAFINSAGFSFTSQIIYSFVDYNTYDIV